MDDTKNQRYKLASRAARGDRAIIDIGGVKIGGGSFAVAAGPCSIENEAELTRAAEAVRAAGATILRGGAFKPRTSPYDFRGLGEAGLRLLRAAGDRFCMPVVSEIIATTDAPLFESLVDIVQIGSRNMQNYELLETVGRMKKPVLLKRGLCATLEEWLLSAEYIMAAGNERVILCERGIRTFERETRNTLDLSAIPALKLLTHLPVLADPSHGTGRRELVAPMALAAVAAGADGLMIEVHPSPADALSDGAQSLTPQGFGSLMRGVSAIRDALLKTE